MKEIASFVCPLVLALAGAGAVRADTIPPIWSSLGIKVADARGLVSNGNSPTTYTYQNGLIKNVDLGFGFKLFGSTYSSVTVSTRGYIAFTGPQTENCMLTNTVSCGHVTSDRTAGDNTMAHSNTVRVAPGWWDSEVINPDTTDTLAGIYVNKAVAGQTAITFQDMTYERLQGTAAANELSTFQAILYLDGSVVFGYETLNVRTPAANGGNNSLDGAAQAVIGVANNSGTNPLDTAQLAQVALGTANAFQSCNANGCYDTVYQKIVNPIFDSTAPGLLLSGVNVVYVPNSTGGWSVANNLPEANVLNGAPEPATFALFGGIVGVGLLFRRKLTQLSSTQINPGDQKI